MEEAGLGLEGEGWVDPLAVANHREPIGSEAGVDLLALGSEGGKVASELVKLLKGQGRPVERTVRDGSWISGGAFMDWLDAGRHPLVLVTHARALWRKEHLEPLLRAMDTTDHLVGRRRVGPGAGLRRWGASWLVRTRFAVPVRDLSSPCWMHRREALSRLQLEATGPGLGLEILAKGTYLAQLVDEVEIPDLPGEGGDWSGDLGWAKRPVFVRAGSGIRST